MQNKKTWLILLIVLAVIAAVGVGLTMSGKLFKGKIDLQTVNCQRNGKGCIELKKGLQQISGPVTLLNSSARAAYQAQNNVTKGELVYEILKTRGVSQKELDKCTESPFSDTKGYKYEKYICYASKNSDQWIKGNPDGTFKPNSFINRAEAAKAFTESDLFYVSQMIFDSNSSPKDVKESDWFYEAVNSLIYYFGPENIVDKNQNFHPANPLTKSDLAYWFKKAKEQSIGNGG